MKLILKEYLASLKERGDLDKAVLPNLLSELGLTVLNTPMIGTRQNGVDIAAVGKIKGHDNQKYLYLFCIKAGNVSRNDWDGNPQAVRSELNEIKDVYRRSNIAEEHKALPIKICLCCGGELDETVLTNWAGYTAEHSDDNISYEEWNGDRLADHMMKVLLARELLDDDVRRNFQKAVAMVNEPDACYGYSFHCLKALLSGGFDNKKQQLLKLRQAYICVHTIASWAIEADNYESIYTISELGLLLCWDAIKQDKPSKKPTKHFVALTGVLDQFLQLYIRLSELYFSKTTYPYADKLHALSVAVRSREPVDVNLAMFSLIGRLAIRGIWTRLLSDFAKDTNPELSKGLMEISHRSVSTIIKLINNNPILSSPLKDDQMIEIALVMLLAQETNTVEKFFGWLRSIGIRTSTALLTNGPYPTCMQDYADLLSHPVDSSQVYRKEACAGSILYPFLFLWLNHVDGEEDLNEFVSRLSDRIPHCSHQAWLPDELTDEQIWSGGIYHGVCISGLNPKLGQEKIIKMLNNAMKECTGINDMQVINRNLYPLLLTACRHYRLPIPPNFWFVSE